jgi:hypothetical protein
VLSRSRSKVLLVTRTRYCSLGKILDNLAELANINISFITDNVVRIALSGATNPDESPTGRMTKIENLRSGNTKNCVVNYWSAGVEAAKLLTLVTDIRLF